MLRKVIKPFAYAADHVTVEALSPGDERDFPVEIVPGLEAEGLIAVGAEDAATDAPRPRRGKAA